MAEQKDYSSREHELGVYALCGGFEIPLGAGQQGTGDDGTISGETGTEGQQPAVAPPIPTPAPVVQHPAPAQAVGECDPSYPVVCIPPITVSGDLDCGDVGYRRFTVVPPDPHRFDADSDGVGCESG